MDTQGTTGLILPQLYRFQKYSFFLPTVAARVQYLISMEGDVKERWRQLCEQAAVERDPNKLLMLMTEINRLLQEKENRLLKLRTAKDSVGKCPSDGRPRSL
jgi:hypothetical protein